MTLNDPTIQAAIAADHLATFIVKVQLHARDPAFRRLLAAWLEAERASISQTEAVDLLQRFIRLLVDEVCEP